MDGMIEDIRRLLGGDSPDGGLLPRSGRVTMSAWETMLRPCDYYAVGINPGGSARDPAPAETIAASLGADDVASTTPGWSYWLDDAQAYQQRRVARVFDGLAGPQARGIPTSNALFLRGETLRSVEGWWGHFERYCLPVHRVLLRRVRPRVLILFATVTWDMMVGRKPPRHWNFSPDVPLGRLGIDHRCGVLLLPHPWTPTWHGISDIIDQAVLEARDYVGRHAGRPAPA